MKKFIYNIACKVIAVYNISEVVPYNTFKKAEDLFELAYMFYLKSNRKESDEAFIAGLFNMGKVFINEKRLKKIINKYN